MLIGGFSQQRLVAGVATAQCIAADALQVEVDFTANQAVQPKTVDCEAMAEQLHVAFGVGASQVDQRPAQCAAQVEVPALRKGSSLRGGFAALNRALLVRLDIEAGMGLQGRQIGEVEALPHLALPKPVEAFNWILK